MEVLSLKWNNYQKVFSHRISELRKKAFYTDATIACQGKLYNVHRFVLSICSDYFNSIFKQTACKNPVIIIKDIYFKDIEYLLDYMYTGEVNVRQNELASLITSAENLQIKGLAVSDVNDLPIDKKYTENKVDSDVRTALQSKPKYRNNKSISRLEQSEENSKNYNSDTNLFCNQNKSEEINAGDTDSSAKFDYFSYAGEGDMEADSNKEMVKARQLNIFPKNGDDTSLSLNNQIKTELMDLPNIENDALLSESTYVNLHFNESGHFIEENTAESFSSFEVAPNISYRQEEFIQRTRDEDVSYVPRTELNQEFLERKLSQYPRKIMNRTLYTRSKNLNFEENSTIKKNFKCRYCGREFTFKTNQLAHERIHTGEKPFNCLFCPLKTALKGNLKNHILKRHNTEWKSVKHLIFPSTDKIANKISNLK